MKEEFLDIVAVIVKQISEGGGSGPRDRNIIEGLLAEGYDLMDIDDALSWFESLTEGAGELGGVEFWPGFKGVRVQARWEREAMTPGAFSYLMRLNRAGFVEDSFREAIVDRVMDLSIADFDVEQMKALLGLVLYSKSAHAPEEVFYRLVDRGRGGLVN